MARIETRLTVQEQQRCDDYNDYNDNNNNDKWRETTRRGERQAMVGLRTIAAWFVFLSPNHPIVVVVVVASDCMALQYTSNVHHHISMPINQVRDTSVQHLVWRVSGKRCRGASAWCSLALASSSSIHLSPSIAILHLYTYYYYEYYLLLPAITCYYLLPLFIQHHNYCCLTCVETIAIWPEAWPALQHRRRHRRHWRQRALLPSIGAHKWWQ
jgi:hypothetical protein